MKVGLFSLSGGRVTSASMLKTIASNAERLGFSTLWAPEHVVLLDQYSSPYPYSQDGRMLTPSTTLMPDPFQLLAFAASVTSKIRLATGICLVPEHNPVVLAKEVATLDFLSGGRFTLGVGVGWLAEEFRAVGVPWEHRARRTREYIEAMRKLWGDELSSYSGEFVSFSNVRSFPKPVRGAKLPVWFGGESGPALRRVAEYGDGWVGFNLTPEDAAAKIRRIEEQLKANGRKRSDIELAASPYNRAGSNSDDLKRYRDAGVEEFVVHNTQPSRNEAEVVSQLEQLARTWVEPGSKL
jgi:probable F420-dependent oxidoreductase